MCRQTFNQTFYYRVFTNFQSIPITYESLLWFMNKQSKIDALCKGNTVTLGASLDTLCPVKALMPYLLEKKGIHLSK